MREDLPDYVRGALARARLSLRQSKLKSRPAKDQDQLLEDVDEWRERTYAPVSLPEYPEEKG